MQEVTANLKVTKQMAAFCFETLQCKLKKQKLPNHPQEFKTIICPIFVTWNMQGQLRGCIGTFIPELLSKILGKYALISALHDDRFEPISIQQIPKLSVCVSLLVNFQVNKDPLDWQIGRHGVILHLTRNGRKYQATYLPQVAQQWQWNHQQTLKSLLQKAGYHGPYNLVKDSIRLTTYQSSKIQLSFAEYISLKNGTQKNGVKQSKEETQQKSQK